jgi:hypothetical protein
MWNCSVVVPFGTLLSEKTGEPDPHHRKLIENADAFAVPTIKKASPNTPSQIRISPSKVAWQALAADAPKSIVSLHYICGYGARLKARTTSSLRDAFRRCAGRAKTCLRRAPPSFRNCKKRVGWARFALPTLRICAFLTSSPQSGCRTSSTARSGLSRPPGWRRVRRRSPRCR